MPGDGHLPIPAAIGKTLLFRDPKNEVFFVVDESNESKIKGIVWVLHLRCPMDSVHIRCSSWSSILVVKFVILLEFLDIFFFEKS